MYVCVCERERSWERVYSFVCVPAIIQQLFTLMCAWFDGVCLSTLVCVCLPPESFGPSLQRNSISVVTHQSACLIPGLDLTTVCACVSERTMCSVNFSSRYLLNLKCFVSS